jgi:hypothetical protein
MKKRLFLALVLGFAGLAFRVISPELHFLAGFQIAMAPRDPNHVKNFAFAAYNLRAIPEGYWVHEVAPAYLLVIVAERDRPEDFQSFTPEQHYVAAVYPCRHQVRRPEEFSAPDTDCVLDSPRDIARTIRHLEAIPKDSKLYPDAVRALTLVEIQRDRPNEFEAARDADFMQCLDRADHTTLAECRNGLMDACDVFGLGQAINKLVASYKPPPSKYHYTEEEVLKRVTAAAAQEVRP